MLLKKKKLLVLLCLTLLTGGFQTQFSCHDPHEKRLTNRWHSDNGGVPVPVPLDPASLPEISESRLNQQGTLAGKLCFSPREGNLSETGTQLEGQLCSLLSKVHAWQR